MTSVTMIISSGSFNATGERNSMFMDSSFQIIDLPIEMRILEELNYKTPPVDYDKSTNIGKSGKIAKNYHAIPNAKVTAYKDLKIQDYSYTDGLGEYELYLEKDIDYSIRIESEIHKKMINNFSVNDGIIPYQKQILEGQITAKLPLNSDIKNVIEFSELIDPNNTSLVTKHYLVLGKIVDGYNNVIEDSEIIIADSTTKEIEVFTKTNNGEYSFKLKRGNYDVIIRSSKHHALIIRNYIFIPERGFLLDVLNRSDIKRGNILLSKGGESLWISI